MSKKIFALGFFDGVHLGHQALLRECIRLASQRNAQPCAVTFDLPPAAIVHGREPCMLNTIDDRLRLLHRFGMEDVCVYRADAQTLAVPWRRFLEELLARGAVGFVCGYDYRFGQNAAGDSEKLRNFCAERGIPCVVVPEQCMDGEKISSTRIRAALMRGDLTEAERLLGHRHILSGCVVGGQQLGRTIGVPTANLLLPPQLACPARGVYVCATELHGVRYRTVTNVGTRPTVHGSGITVESWLLHYDGDLYGTTLTLELCRYLRPERKFDTLQALRAQIMLDAQEAEREGTNQ